MDFIDELLLQWQAYKAEVDEEKHKQRNYYTQMNERMREEWQEEQRLAEQNRIVAPLLSAPSYATYLPVQATMEGFMDWLATQKKRAVYVPGTGLVQAEQALDGGPMIKQ